MSRIGRAPIPVPTGVEITIEPERVSVNGPKGALSERIPRDITVARDADQLVVTRPTDRGELAKGLTVHAHGFSATARERIEAAGGSCIVVES